jgi:hypothetical protein
MYSYDRNRKSRAKIPKSSENVCMPLDRRKKERSSTPIKKGMGSDELNAAIRDLKVKVSRIFAERRASPEGNMQSSEPQNQERKDE